jgi:hypothetical protein
VYFETVTMGETGEGTQFCMSVNGTQFGALAQAETPWTREVDVGAGGDEALDVGGVELALMMFG